MKKMVSKVLCIITALCVFLGTMPLVAYAEDDLHYDKIGTVENVELIKYSPGTELNLPEKDNTAGLTANKFYGDLLSIADTPYLFYSQLDSIQKKVYDTFLTTEIGESFIVDTDRSYTGVAETEEGAIEAAQILALNDIAAGLSAATEDYPMYFWVNSFNFNYYYSDPVYDGTNYTYIIHGIYMISVSYDGNSYSSYDEVKEKHSQLLDAVNNFKVNGINRYEKLKSINDQLCDIITYPEVQGYFSDGTPFYGPMAHHPTGALLNGSAVCEGYAEALKLICDREGIPCITVLGTGNGGAHKWNYVKMDDGLWYLVDTTWNDQVTAKYYNWFITGSDFDGGDHINVGQMYTGVDFALAYPTLSTENYQISGLRSDTGDLAYNNTNGVLYVGKEFTTIQSVFNCIGLPDNCEISWTGFYKITEQVIGFTNTESGAGKTYIVAMRGDVNATDTVTTDDYNLVVSTAGAKHTVTENTANYYAGDMTQDGAIDGFDAIALDLYLDDTLVFD